METRMQKEKGVCQDMSRCCRLQILAVRNLPRCICSPILPCPGVVRRNIGDDDDEVMVVGCGPFVVLVAGGSEQKLN